MFCDVRRKRVVETFAYPRSKVIADVVVQYTIHQIVYTQVLHILDPSTHANRWGNAKMQRRQMLKGRGLANHDPAVVLRQVGRI